MTTTTNLALPQWQKTDRIMMDDFNDAMSKLDAHSHTVKLKSFTVTEDASTFDMDVSDIDWNLYSKVVVRITMTASTSDTFLRVNGQDTSAWNGIYGAGVAGGAGFAVLQSKNTNWLEFLVAHNAQNLIRTFYDSTAYLGHGYDTTYSYSQFNTMNMFTRNSNTIGAGTTVDIWGIR